MLFSCSQEKINNISDQDPILTPIEDDPFEIKVLSLGDGYTKGHNVCETCNYPAQLVDSISKYYSNEFSFDSKIIAEILVRK